MVEKTHIEDLRKNKMEFSRMIAHMFPNTANTPLPKLISGFLYGLSTAYCYKDGDSNFAYLRGGIARSNIQSSQEIEKRLADNFKEIQADTIGTNLLAKPVLEHMFAETKDMDIYINRKENANDNDVISYLEYQSKMLQALAPEFEFIPIRFRVGNNDEKMIFGLKIIKNNKTVFDLSFTNYPRTQKEWEQDIRTKADIDLLSFSGISSENNDVFVSFDKSLVERIENYYIPTTWGIFQFEDKIYASLSSGFREIGDRALMIPMLFSHENSSVSILNMMENYGGSHEMFKRMTNNKIPLIPEWTKAQEQEISGNRSRYVALLSDIVYPFLANPFVALPFAHLHGYLPATPLGQLIDTDDKMLKVYRLLAEKVGGKIEDTFLTLSLSYSTKLLPLDHEQTGKNGFHDGLILIDVFKEAGLISPNMPRTFSTLLELLNPLLYRRSLGNKEIGSVRP